MNNELKKFNLIKTSFDRGCEHEKERARKYIEGFKYKYRNDNRVNEIVNEMLSKY